MTKICLKSKYTTSLKSNVVHMGKLKNEKYNCPEGLCAELGSEVRPVTNLTEAFSLIKRRYSEDTPVTLLMDPGIYPSKEELNFPENLVGCVCLSGHANIESDFILKNHKELLLKNINLKGDLIFLADSNKTGKFDMDGGALFGTYFFQIKEQADYQVGFENMSHEMGTLDTLHQELKGSTHMKDSEHFNGFKVDKDASINHAITDGFGSLRMTFHNYKKNSPEGRKFNSSDESRLYTKISNSTFQPESLEISLSDKANMEYVSLDSNYKIDGSIKDVYSSCIMKDSSSLKLNSIRNNYKGIMNNDYVVYADSFMGNSSAEISSTADVYDFLGNGTFEKKKVSDYANLKTDITSRTFKIPVITENSTNLSSIEITKNGSVRQLFDSCNISTPQSRTKQILRDEANMYTSYSQCDICAAGIDEEISGNSKLTKEYNNHKLSCGEDGYLETLTLSGQGLLEISQTNTKRELFNVKDKYILDWKLTDDSKVESNCNGCNTKIVFRKSTDESEVGVINVEQKKRSSYTHETYNCKKTVDGGCISKYTCYDSSIMKKSSKNNTVNAISLRSHDILNAASLYNNAKATLMGSGNTKNISGGVISGLYLFDEAQANTISRNGNLSHNGQTSHHVELNDKSNYEETIFGGKTISSKIQSRIISNDNSTALGISSNNSIQSGVIHMIQANHDSNVRYTMNSDSLEGDSELLGNVDFLTNNTTQQGNFHQRNGSLRMSTTNFTGKVKVEDGDFFTNLSTFKNDSENFDLANTTLQMNSTTVHNVGKGSNIKSMVSDGKTGSMDIKVSSLKNEDMNTSHIELSHDDNEDSKTQLDLGITSTTSNKVIASKTPEKAIATFSPTMNNSSTMDVVAQVRELIERSDSIKKG